jgi:hypothetical protein
VLVDVEAVAVIFWFVQAALFGFWGYTIGVKTSHPTRGFALGFFFSWLGVLIVWLVGRNEPRVTPGTRLA